MSANDRIAVSSWSLHRLLGVTHPHDLASLDVPAAEPTFGKASARLVDLPALVAANGIGRLEICSFHLPSRDPAFCADLAGALATAGVKLQTLLIEAGDVSDPETAARDARWMSAWVETALELGAENARLIAGKQAFSDEAIALAARHLNAIADDHDGAPIRLVVENWFDLLATPQAVDALLARTEGRIGLNGDFGNWTGPGKYDALSAIMGRAELCHAKASFAGGTIDRTDYERCLALSEATGYAGPYTLIFDAETPDEWTGIKIERDTVLGAIGGQGR